MSKALQRLTLVTSIFFFLFVIAAFYQTWNLLQTRGTSWEISYIIDGEQVVEVESIYTYVVGVVLISFILVLLVENYIQNKHLRELLSRISPEEE